MELTLLLQHAKNISNLAIGQMELSRSDQIRNCMHSMLNANSMKIKVLLY